MQTIDENENYSIFLADAMHTLKNVIAPINIYSEVIRSGRLDNNKIMDIAGKIEICANNAVKVCVDLMNIFRIRGKLMEVRREKVSPFEILQNFYFMIENNLKQKHIELENNLDPDVFLCADAEMMGSVFMNLLINAVKFSHPGGKICVDGEIIDDNWFEIAISDEGIGIDEQKIAEKLQQGNFYSNPGTDGEPGTGLGLLVVHNTIERNGGTMRAFNNKNGGATFAFKLPLWKEN